MQVLPPLACVASPPEPYPDRVVVGRQRRVEGGHGLGKTGASGRPAEPASVFPDAGFARPHSHETFH